MGRSGEVRKPNGDRSVVDKEAIASLSAREAQVLSFAASGYLDKQIGAAMGVSVNTLRTYWQRIRAKLGDVSRSALAVAYVEHVAESGRAPRPFEPEHDWEIDLRRNVWRRVSSRALAFDAPVDQEIPLEDVIAMSHPEDQARIRAMVVAMRRGELDSFVYTARWITVEGMESSIGLIQLERDSNGTPVRAFGKRMHNIELTPNILGRVQVGHWCLDLQTREFTIDSGFREIFRIGPEVEDVARATLERLNPDEREEGRMFVRDTVAAGKERARAMHRIMYEDGTTRWITVDLRVEYKDGQPLRALGTDIAFD